MLPCFATCEFNNSISLYFSSSFILLVESWLNASFFSLVNDFAFILVTVQLFKILYFHVLIKIDFLQLFNLFSSPFLFLGSVDLVFQSNLCFFCVISTFSFSMWNLTDSKCPTLDSFSSSNSFILPNSMPLWTSFWSLACFFSDSLSISSSAFSASLVALISSSVLVFSFVIILS